jgi:hypothetical protein
MSNVALIKTPKTKGLELKFELLEKLITLFSKAKKNGPVDLARWASKAKNEVLIGGIGQSEEVADQYINAALERINH